MQITVNKVDTIITAADVYVNYADPSGKLVATLTDEFGNAISDNVTVNINGAVFTVKSNSKGKITVSTAKLTPKTYTVTITYNGDGNYNPASATATISVNKTETVMNAPDTSVAFKNTTKQTIATLTDAYGKGFAVYVDVTLNGETSAVRANYWGEISVSTADLAPGTYDVSISYKGNGNYYGSNATAQITVTKAGTVMIAPDTSVAYKNTTDKTIATITDAYGKSRAVYVNVTLNGETFAVRANYWGEISVSTASLAPGTYDVTVSYEGNGNYDGSTATAQITVEKADTTITAQDISVTYKDVDGELVATLTNAYGNPLSVYVVVNINGVNYNELADSNGQITLSTKNLASGTYTATITYNGNGNYNPTSTTATVTVTKVDTVITAPDVTVESGDPDGKLVATLTNAYGKALGVYVTYNLDGADYTVRADSKGQISIPTKDLDPGSYTTVITYFGNGNYNPTTTTANIAVI